MDNNFFKVDDLVSNPTARVPICLCLDTSGSMNAVEGGTFTQTGRTEFIDGREWNIVEGGITRISELQKGINLFYDSIRKDEVAVYSAEICIVTFDSMAKCIVDFDSINKQNNIPDLIAESGDTYMGEGINLALDLLERRKNEYKSKGVDYFQPWLVIMTDGQPNGDFRELNRATERINELVKNKKLTIFPIAIGNEADMSALSSLSPNRQPLRLKGLKFCEFFKWLSQSVSKTSQSTPGEKIKLDTDGIKGWGEL